MLIALPLCFCDYRPIYALQLRISKSTRLSACHLLIWGCRHLYAFYSILSPLYRLISRLEKDLGPLTPTVCSYSQTLHCWTSRFPVAGTCIRPPIRNDLPSDITSSPCSADILTLKMHLFCRSYPGLTF